MTQLDWGRLRAQLILLGCTAKPAQSMLIDEVVMELDKHFFQTLSGATPKGKSTGRPKKHINLAKLAELQKSHKSLRAMGLELNVSRETIRRTINDGAKR